jgi:CBS domain-containing protein
MQAKDVMTREVVTVAPETKVQEVARLLLERRISAVPVIDAEGGLAGIVSEGDLMRRAEGDTTRPESWWLALASAPRDAALDYIKTHGGHARDVMTREPVTVEEDTPVWKIARLLEKHRIKRVPVLRDGKMVGVVSRADLLRGLAAQREAPAPSADDRSLKAAVEQALRDVGVGTQFVTVVVSDGVVDLWGAVDSDAEKQALGIAAENVPGVREVRNEIGVMPPNVRSVLWAE